MKSSPSPRVALIALSLLLTLPAVVRGQGSSLSSFTYQGRLNDASGPANGTYDFWFALKSAPTGGNTFGVFPTADDVGVTNGLFTVALDFTAVPFDGSAQWLEIYVRTNGNGVFTMLSPRQQLTATPYAIRAANFSGQVAASQLTGTIASSNLAAGSVTADKMDPALGLWIRSGSNIFYLTGGVGINNNNPNGAALAVGGAVNVEGVVSANAMSAASVTASQMITPEVSAPGAQSLEFKVNGLRALRIERATDGFNDYPNISGGYVGNIISNGVLGGFIGGGGGFSYPNRVGGNFAAVLGGSGNSAIGESSTVSGGSLNRAAGIAASVGGGVENYAVAPFSAIGGGVANVAAAGADGSVIGGGRFNFISTNQSYAFIGGGTNNQVLSTNATIVGGAWNAVQTNADLSAIGGGIFNSALSRYSVVAGGRFNRAGVATNQFFSGGSTVGGGEDNIAPGFYSVVSGGRGNEASGHGAVVGGGSIQYVTDFGAGWFANRARGISATVPGGAGNYANGDFSFAAGRAAAANHPGTFVWNSFINDLGSDQFTSTGPAQFLINARGGVGIGTAAPGQPLQVGDINTPNSQGMMRFASRSGTGPSSRYWDIGVPEGDQDIGGKYYSFVIDDPVLGTHPEFVIRWDTGNVGIGRTSPIHKLDVLGGATGNAIQGTCNDGGASGVYGENLTGNGFGVAGRASNAGIAVYGDNANAAGYAGYFNGNVRVTGTVNPPSDRNVKHDFENVDSREVLEKVAALSIQSWAYTNDTRGTRHLGPVAQDFKAAFGLGADDKSIATVDADGVALAAIQGLNEKVEARSQTSESRIQKLETENAELKRELSEIKQLLTKLSGDRN